MGIANFALGSVITIIVDSAWRWLVEGRRYVLDLRRRFFDIKLATTLDSIREWRAVYDYTRTVLKGIEHSLEMPSPLDQLYLQGVLAQSQQQVQEIQRATRNISSTLDFFYGERVTVTLKEIDSLIDASVPHVADLVDAIMRLRFSRERMAQVSITPDLWEFERMAHDKAKRSIEALLKVLGQVDNLISECIRMFRADFRPYQHS